MRKKKMLCLLSAVLMLGMMPQALAAEGNHTKVTASCILPEISVTVPQTGAAFINPYQMDVTINATETDAQIISTPAAIENESEVPLQVTVTVTGQLKEESTMRFSSAPTNGIGTAKSAFLYFEIVPANSANSAVWADEYDDEKHLLVRVGSRTKRNMVILSQSDKDEVFGKPLGTVDKDGCFGAFRLTGDCTKNPRVPWNEKDGLDVEITFSFKPLARQQG